MTVTDALDLRILDVLKTQGRISNSQLAAKLDVAPSTTHLRVRGLVERGVITGFLASIDQEQVGIAIQALVGVTLRPGARHTSINAFSEDARSLPEVLQLFFLGGGDDFIVHIGVADTGALRKFVVDHLSGHPSVASTRTSVVFNYHRNGVAASF
ncbi:Lrp/AsnC family transcriptional regulator [Lysobacter korlensis]|uniref:Lrp/AsnC family transcriptional regulator n=1 Tax=Lysobacter korlensis TaxID=553636 RepID=A0ABV6RW53_9GAMM